MNRTRSLSTIAGVALALTLGLGANPASATPAADLWYTTTGAGGWTEVNVANTTVGNCPQSGTDPACGTGTSSFVTAGGGFRVNIDTNTNGPGDPGFSDTSNASINVTNLSATGSQQIWFVAGGTGFTLPLGNELVNTNAGNTIRSVTGGSVKTFACIRLDNKVDNLHSCDSALAPDFITPAVNGPIPGGTGVSWNLPTSDLFPVSLTSPYSLIDQVELTLEHGAQVNFSSTALVIETPEPASLAIFGTALLGFGLIRRRRRNS